MRRRTLMALALVGCAAACSPVYVFKAATAQAGILGNRRPLPEVILDPSTDEHTRGVLTLVMEARAFALNELGLDVGGSYTSYSPLASDTLALVLSAAHRDLLAPRTWWFPVVGHVPYRGFFSLEDALGEQRRLESEGFDTYLRPTAAFSTLGWFDDPLLSSVVDADHVEVVTTVLHELSHNHLFVPGQVTFNESFATFVGRVAAAEFFCTRPGGGPDTVWCSKARARWRDSIRFSAFLDGFVAKLEALYADPTLTPDDKVVLRENVFREAMESFGVEVAPALESLTFRSFTDLPLNNATLLSRVRYYHRLEAFDALLASGDGLRRAVELVRVGAASVSDPFTLLPGTPQ